MEKRAFVKSDGPGGPGCSKAVRATFPQRQPPHDAVPTSVQVGVLPLGRQRSGAISNVGQSGDGIVGLVRKRRSLAVTARGFCIREEWPEQR